MECDISSLSCEFITAILSRDLNHPLAMLKLDHNNIGNEGVNYLAQGLNMNSNLQILSLAYCNIDNEGARALMEIIIN